MCGIVGIISSEGDVVTDIYDALITLQHRGQDAGGVITFDNTFHLKKGRGMVSEVFNEKNISRLRGSCGLGHVRYPTVGPGTGEDAQPFSLNAPFGIAMVHNGNLVNYHELRKEIAGRDHRLLASTSDLEVILNIFANELAKSDLDDLKVDDIFRAVGAVFKRAVGAYSVLAYIAGKGFLAFRDPSGIRPLVFAKSGPNGADAYGFFSESVSAGILGYEKIGDVAPGEAVFIDHDLKVTRKKVAAKTHMPCMFEWIYFARPDSIIDDISVYHTRRRLGKELARRWEKLSLDVDVVMPVPDSAKSAALAFANETGIRYREGFVKNRYVGRTFIMPGQKKRKSSIRYKLNTIPLEFRGRDVLLIDDSIVRGNTSKSIIEMARKAGANRVYFASCSAPLRHPCVYGIDMSTTEDFVATGRNEEEIAEVIGADKVIYQTVEGMVRAARKGNDKISKFCLACFNGDYPTGDVKRYLDAIRKDRKEAHGQ